MVNANCVLVVISPKGQCGQACQKEENSSEHKTDFSSDFHV